MAINSIMQNRLIVLFTGGFLSHVAWIMYRDTQYSAIPEGVVHGRFLIGMTVLFVVVLIGVVANIAR